MRNALTCLLTTAALVAATAAIASAAGRYVAYSGFLEGPVAGAPTSTYDLRSRYIAPATWKAAKAKPGAVVRRFGPVTSCRIAVTIAARAVADADEAAAARVDRLLPSSPRFVYDEGTRQSAAWRVVRDTSAGTITGMLVRPAPTVRSQPPGQRIWLELRASGRVDPRTECHAGGPRTVAAAFGDLLAAGSLGGFQPR